MLGSLSKATPERNFFFSHSKLKEKNVFCYFFPCSLTFQKRLYLENRVEITPSIIFCIISKGRKLL